jgi:hypothetical protein
MKKYNPNKEQKPRQALHGSVLGKRRRPAASQQALPKAKRTTAPYNETLEMLLDLLKGVPDDTPEKLGIFLRASIDTGQDPAPQDKVDEHYITQIYRLAPQTRAYIGPVDPINMQEARRRYDVLMAARLSFRQIGSVNSQIYRDRRFDAASKPGLLEAWRCLSLNLYTDNNSPALELSINEEGQFKAMPHLIAQALDGVEPWRIRECLICKSVFWAGRINKWCCSDGCSLVLRQRRFRKNKEQYEANRARKEMREKLLQEIGKTEEENNPARMNLPNKNNQCSRQAKKISKRGRI